jgi:flagellar hook-length control protein FliK
MMTQSVITQAANLFGNASGSVNSKSRQSGSGFDILLGNNLKTNQDAGNTKASAGKKSPVTDKNSGYDRNRNEIHNNKSTDESSKTTEKNAAEKLSQQSNASREKKIGAKDTKVSNSEADKDEQDSSKVNEDLTKDEQQIATMAELLNQFQVAIMEILQLTPEEFNQLMSDYQAMNGEITSADLLMPDTLRQLLLFQNGETDPMALITNEDFADSLNQLLKAAEQLKTEAGLSMTEQQMKDILEQLKNATDNLNTLQSELNADDLKAQKETGQQEAVNVTGKELAGTDDAVQQSYDVSKFTITREAGEQSQADGNQSDHNQYEASDQFQQFMDKLVSVAQTTQTDMNGNLTQITEIREIASQIIEQIKVVVNPDQTSMELQLNPEHLGKVNLTIQSKDGIMTAHFVVQNELSKEAIESQMHTLRDTLNQQGIKVDTIEVTVAAYASEQHSNEEQDGRNEEKKDQNGRKITMEEAFGMSEVPVEETSDVEIDDLRGSQIDYTA